MHELLQNYRELSNPSYVGSLRYSLAKNKLDVSSLITQSFFVKWLSANKELV
jgi:hypothetical protein